MRLLRCHVELAAPVVMQNERSGSTRCCEVCRQVARVDWQTGSLVLLHFVCGQEVSLPVLASASQAYSCASVSIQIINSHV